MTKFGKSLKPVNVDRLIDFIKTETQKKPKKYRPKMTEEESTTRRKKTKYSPSRRGRNLHGYTVYYDRKRKGWFYRDKEGNIYGYRGSKDKGFSHKKNAIDALQRRWRKEQKQIEPPEGPGIDIPPDFPDPEPLPEFPEVIVQYDAYCNQCRRNCYGLEAPSDSLYVRFFNKFVVHNPSVDIGGWTRRQLEEEDGNFSITLMLSYQSLRPVYDEIDGVEYVVGLEDL